MTARKAQSDQQLTASEAVRQLRQATDCQLYPAIRRQLSADRADRADPNSAQHSDWIKQFLLLGGWENLIDALHCLGNVNGKNGNSCHPSVISNQYQHACFYDCQ